MVSKCVTHLSLTYSSRLLSCRCHRHTTLFFPLRAPAPCLALCDGCGDRYNTVGLYFFSSMAASARMQLHHAAHCAHMVSTDKTASDSLPLFSACMTVKESYRLWLLDIISPNLRFTPPAACYREINMLGDLER